MSTTFTKSLVCLTLVFCTSVLAKNSGEVNERRAGSPDYKPIENHFLLFPMTSKDFWNWDATGSAVFLKNKAVLAPETTGAKGSIFSQQPNPKRDHWYAILDFNIGRDKVKETNQSGEGLGIYYLRNFDSGDS